MTQRNNNLLDNYYPDKRTVFVPRMRADYALRLKPEGMAILGHLMTAERFDTPTTCQQIANSLGIAYDTCKRRLDELCRCNLAKRKEDNTYEYTKPLQPFEEVFHTRRNASDSGLFHGIAYVRCLHGGVVGWQTTLLLSVMYGIGRYSATELDATYTGLGSMVGLSRRKVAQIADELSLSGVLRVVPQRRLVHLVFTMPPERFVRLIPSKGDKWHGSPWKTARSETESAPDVAAPAVATEPAPPPPPRKEYHPLAVDLPEELLQRFGLEVPQRKQTSPDTWGLESELWDIEQAKNVRDKMLNAFPYRQVPNRTMPTAYVNNAFALADKLYNLLRREGVDVETAMTAAIAVRMGWVISAHTLVALHRQAVREHKANGYFGNGAAYFSGKLRAYLRTDPCNCRWQTGAEVFGTQYDPDTGIALPRRTKAEQ